MAAGYVNRFSNDPVFQAATQQAEDAIAKGVHPKLISQGTSGSYFVRNVDNEMIAVFKPRCEEPFGPLNPKWKKWLQRCCSPCCFGRGCILTNNGYLSETGACIVDTMLDLNVVPKTKVVELTSSVFCYSKADLKKDKLPPKIGSFQFFVKDYKDAGEWLQAWADQKPPLDPDLHHTFVILFQKMVVLDYVIRNTDRSNQNWMIKYCDGNVAEGKKSSVEIAVIDNGLAFPYKHPDHCRKYPFYWVHLPVAQEPFKQEIIDLVLPKIEKPQFIVHMCKELQYLFEYDAGYRKESFKGQMTVLRGQIANLRAALTKRMNPCQLAALPVLLATPRSKLYRPSARKGRRMEEDVLTEIAADLTWEQAFSVHHPYINTCFHNC